MRMAIAFIVLLLATSTLGCQQVELVRSVPADFPVWEYQIGQQNKFVAFTYNEAGVLPTVGDIYFVVRKYIDDPDKGHREIKCHGEYTFDGVSLRYEGKVWSIVAMADGTFTMTHGECVQVWAPTFPQTYINGPSTPD